jgi:hypothetical protein
VEIGKTYYLNIYDQLTLVPAFHETFEKAVAAARHDLSEEPQAKLLHILECSPIKGLEPLELYP